MYIVRSGLALSMGLVPAFLPRNFGRRIEEEEDGSGDIVLVPNKVKVFDQARDLRVANVRAIPTDNQEES